MYNWGGGGERVRDTYHAFVLRGTGVVASVGGDGVGVGLIICVPVVHGITNTITIRATSFVRAV